VRRTIKKAAPEAEEAISYQIPAVKLDGKYLMAFAGWKNHISIYPIPDGPEAFKKELAPYIAGRGTVRFPIAEPIPFKLVEKIVKFHLRGLEEGQSRYRSSP